jgi:hypothetical protein
MNTFKSNTINKLTMKTIQFLLFSLSSILVVGCSQKFIVNIDSLSSSVAKEKTKYILIPGNNDISNSDLQYMEFESYTDKVLQDLGFICIFRFIRSVIPL